MMYIPYELIINTSNEQQTPCRCFIFEYQHVIIATLFMLNSGIFHLSRFLILLTIFTGSVSLFAVNTDEDSTLISFRADNESVRNVLQRLSADHGLNLTYNASNEDFDATINYQAEDKAPETILSKVLALIGYEHTSIGNQLVIHRSERFEALGRDGALPADVAVNHVDTILRIVEVPVVIVDTVIIVETRTEIVQRAQPVPATVRPLIVNRPSYRPHRIRNERFSMSLSYAQMLAGYGYPGAGQFHGELQEVRDADGTSFRNYMITGGLHYQIGAMFLSTTLSVNSFSIPFSYKELFTSGGYHLVDTLDSFYIIVDGNEEWVHITDSTYIPLDSQELFYDRTNNLGILEVRFNIAYDLYISSNSNFFIHGGVQAGIPIWQHGNTIMNTEGYPAVPLARNELNNFVYGFHLGPGLRTKLNDGLDFVMSATYQQYITDLYKSYPIKRNLRGVALQVGIKYYL